MTDGLPLVSAPLVSARGIAVVRQRSASNPGVSAWVGASAGSGKTKVLIDRVLRLLLQPEAAPGRILCLTFTKAAAAEMQTRLATRLGRWATLADGDLRDRIAEVTGEAVLGEDVSRARGLFCRVLEQPGGMRISTIHAFCQSLLRSFPLEARLSPGFTLMEEADSAAMLAEAREAALAGGAIPEDALHGLARLVSADEMGNAVRALVGKRAALDALPPAADLVLRDVLGLRDDECEADMALRLTTPPEALRARLPTLLEHKAADVRKAAAVLADLLALPDEARARRSDAWRLALFTEKETRRKKVEPVAELAAEMERVEAVLSAWTSHRLHAATGALIAAARPVLRDYRARKERRGALDFDDLIAHAQALLRDPGSAWVLFKLDGGLDHLLLDEAQDTNPVQWGIADTLAAEFFAGAGTREPSQRTLFVVGDPKQSIYSFQGADAEGFDHWRARFGARVRATGSEMEEVPLETSFRSCAPILTLVDSVFAGDRAREGVVPRGDVLRHAADRAGHAGMVEVWPLIRRTRPPAAEPWIVPEKAVEAKDAESELAAAVAARIHRMTLEDALPARADRLVRPGDVMVLVRRRTRFVSLLVRELKHLKVPVAGVDRIELASSLAVRDVCAVLDVLLLPEDDLTLAAALRSPLLGVSEEELFNLAHGREGPLWFRLLDQEGKDTPPGRAADELRHFARRTDYVTPHALISELLGERGGRARLVARLGADAGEALDELLSAALRYEARHPPSLQGFLHWLRRGGAVVKRETEGAGDAVRIMTAHGAKGLQAPVVIIPDIGRGGARDTLLWAGSGAPGDDALPLWAPRREFHAKAWTDARAAKDAADGREENRLLYVALTRAEDRLLICGLEPGKAPKHPTWHGLVSDGMLRLEAAPGWERVMFDPAAEGLPGGDFGPEGWRLTSPQEAPPVEDPVVLSAEAAVLPDWAHRPAPAEASEDPVAPSRTEGEEGPAAAPHGPSDPGGRRFRRGLLIHALLQFLPDHPPADRARIARAHLARPGHDLSEEEREATWEEVAAVLDHPALRDAFAPGSLAEAPLAGRVGGVTIAGQVDRLWIGPDRILVADYKTNRPPPERVEAVAPAYLRQMAAYRAVLRAAWPGRRVECALVWTWNGRVMFLPDDALDPHAPPGA